MGDKADLLIEFACTAILAEYFQLEQRQSTCSCNADHLVCQQLAGPGTSKGRGDAEAAAPTTSTASAHASQANKNIVLIMHNDATRGIDLIDPPEIGILSSRHTDRHKVTTKARIMHLSKLFKGITQNMRKAIYVHTHSQR
jgi:hypothetical protein